MRIPASPLARSLALVAALAGTARAAGAQTPERHTLTGSDVAVYNVVGKVRLVAGTANAVVVELTRGGADARELRVETGALRGRETLRVIYPGDRIIYPGIGRWSRTRTRIREDGTFGDGGERGDRGFGGRDIEIRGDGRGTEAWADLTVSVPRGQKIALHLIAGETTVTNVDGDLLVDVGSADVRTERTRGRLVVDVGSGRIRVDGAEGDLLIDSGSGDADVRGVRGTSLRIDTGSGSMTGEDIQADRVDLDTGSGRTRMTRVRTRNLRVDTGSGDVDVALLDDVDDVRVDTGSGSVTLRVPSNLGAQLEVDTGSGGISSDLPITVSRRERDRLVGQIGDGRGRIVIDTGSGGVRILRN